jgi:hypothetical protein
VISTFLLDSLEELPYPRFHVIPRQEEGFVSYGDGYRPVFYLILTFNTTPREAPQCGVSLESSVFLSCYPLGLFYQGNGVLFRIYAECPQYTYPPCVAMALFIKL